MAKRGSLYRCHLFSFSGPQTEGVEAEWTQNLAPIGDEEVLSGEPVELHVRIDGAKHPLKPTAKIRFDILEEDWFLTGGRDDAVLSIVGTNAPWPADDYPMELRTTVHRLAPPGVEPLAALRTYRDEVGDAYAKQILLLEAPGEKASTFHIVAGWTAQRLEDYANSEMNFIVNVDDAFEDQTRQILDVSPDRAPPADERPRPWHPRTIMRRVFRLLTTSLTDWSVTKEDAHNALTLLRSMAPEDLVNTLLLMRQNRTWTALGKAMQDADEPDALAWLDIEESTDVNRGYLVPGDELIMAVYTGGYASEADGLTVAAYEALAAAHPAARDTLERRADKSHGRVTFNIPAFSAGDRASLGDEVLKRLRESAGGFTLAAYAALVSAHPAARDTLERLADKSEIRVRFDIFGFTREDRAALGAEVFDVLLQASTRPLRVERDGSVELPDLRVNLALSGMSPVEAVNTIARAYVEGRYYVSPTVVLGFRRRGQAYSMHAAPLAELGAFGHRSTYAPDPNAPAQRRASRIGAFGAYIANARGTDLFTISALLLYHKWIEDHLNQPDFFTTEPEEVWEKSLKIAGQPPPPTALDPWLRMCSWLRAELSGASLKERPKLQSSYDKFVAWVADHADDQALLKTTDPVTIYVGFKMEALRTEIAELQAEALRKRREEAEKIDHEFLGKRLDEVIDYTIRYIRHAEDPYVLEGVLEEGGIGPFFKERKGIGHLVMPSELERKLRNFIADEYFHDFVERMSSPGAVRAMQARTVDQDFKLWVGDRPEYVEALEVAYSHPYVERYEFEVELSDWDATVEIVVGFTPILGQIVAVGELTTGTSLMGRSLGPVEQGVTAASIFLPAALKLGRGAMGFARASTLAREYNLTAREADALYRAVLPLGAGSAKRKLLEDAVTEVNAGKRITDRKTIAELEALMREMGLMDRNTARALGAPTTERLAGAALVSDESALRLIRETLGEETAVYRGALSQENRNAVRAAIKASPHDVRRILAAETQEGFLRYKGALVERMKTLGMLPEEVTDLETALAKLNEVRQAKLAPVVKTVTRDRVIALGTEATFREEGKVVAESMARRARRAIEAAEETTDAVARKNLRDRAKFLEGEITALNDWLKSGDLRVEEFRRLVGQSAHLKEIVAKGGDPMLRRLWVQFVARPGGGRPLRVGFERYVEIMERHHIGNFGEFEVAFRLGETHIIIKAPDEFVTLRGIDLIAIPRGGGMIHVIDNKALSEAEVAAVNALTHNLPRNLATDVSDLAKMVGDPNLPKEFQDAFTRLSAASQEIATKTGHMTKDQLRGGTAQSLITDALKKQNIERVVTNAGGEASDISANLKALGIDMADLN